MTVEHHRVPLVSVLVLVPAGASADRVIDRALPRSPRDMLDEGCGDHSALDVHEALGRIGAQLETDVGHDATVIGLTTLQRYLDRGLELVSDMVMRPALRAAGGGSRARAAPASLLQLRDLPPAVADRVFAQLLYRGIRTATCRSGPKEPLRALSVRDISGFHRRAFGRSGRH